MPVPFKFKAHTFSPLVLLPFFCRLSLLPVYLLQHCRGFSQTFHFPLFVPFCEVTHDALVAQSTTGEEDY